MKINIVKTANGKFWPADEEAEMLIKKLRKGDVYKADITVNQNYELHKKVFGFFGFCTNYYYGDMESSKNKYSVDYVRGEITKAAGYYEQVFNRSGGFKLVPKSIAYESMADDERQTFYKAITDAALKMVFNNGPDDNTLNQLLSWF